MKTPATAWLDTPELPEYLTHVQRELDHVLGPRTEGLKQAVQLLTAVPGKMLRPRLLFAAARGSAAPLSRLVTAGASIELLHLGTLVHDDIIDGAQSRRGAPSINAQEGDRQALLLGDYLLAKACQQASRVSGEAGVLVAATIAALCEGESRELRDLHNTKRSPEAYTAVIRDKTAVLFSTACQLGGMLAALPSVRIAALARYGEHFGLMFQLLDDVRDFLSTADQLGKPVGQDVREGNYTLPVILALAGEEKEALYALLTEGELRFEALVKLLLDQNAFQQTLAEATRQAALAAREVYASNLPSYLAAFPEAYQRHVRQTLIAPRFRPNFQGRF